MREERYFRTMRRMAIGSIVMMTVGPLVGLAVIIAGLCGFI